MSSKRALKRRSVVPHVMIATLLCVCIAGPACGNNESNNTNNPVDMNTIVNMDMADAGPDFSSDMEEMTTALKIENLPGGNPLVPEVAMYPFPSDFYLAKKSTTRTGRVIAAPQDALPSSIPTALFETTDGFSRIPSILSYLPNSVDPASLPGQDDIGATIKEDSPVVLVEADTWTRVPILAEVDLNADKAEERALIIRPMRTLKANTTHVVILREGLKDSTGKLHVANDAFRALRDDIPTDSDALESQREGFKVVRDAFGALNIDPQKVVLSWSFTTRSAESVTDPMRAMQQVAETYTLGDYTLTSVDGDERNHQFVGTFKAPNFVSPDGVLVLDEQGTPKQFGERDVEFNLTIPKDIVTPRPVIVFGHGFFSEKVEATRGSFNDLCRQEQFSAIAVNYEGFDEGSIDTTVPILSNKLADVDQLIAKQMQAYTHFTAVARLVREKLSADVAVGDQPVAVLDAAKVHYMGISNGATFGAVIAATTKIFERAVLVVGGGGLIHFLERAETWNGLGVLFKRRYKNPLDLQLVLSLLQHKFDAIDSMNYVERLTEDRLAGTGTTRVSMHMAVHDSSVANILTMMVARTAKTPLIVPSPMDIWGVSTVSPEMAADLPSALVVYDEKLEPRPAGNVAPAKDNGAHESIRKLDVYKKNVAAFINDGKLVQVCDGPCDPN